MFDELLNNNWRVLYQIWTPTTWVASNEFELIGFPLDYSISTGEKVFKLLPTRLQYDTAFAFDFLDALLMSDEELCFIYHVHTFVHVFMFLFSLLCML